MKMLCSNRVFKEVNLFFFSPNQPGVMSYENKVVANLFAVRWDCTGVLSEPLTSR